MLGRIKVNVKLVKIVMIYLDGATSQTFESQTITIEARDNGFAHCCVVNWNADISMFVNSPWQKI